jgi:serine/threonine-protein kinase
VGLGFDATGDLFVANCTTCLTGQAGTNNVVEVPPHSNTPSVTITNGITYPFDLAIDSSGTLYVSNLGCYSPSCTSQVSEYPHGYTSGNPSTVITVKYPLGLAIDSAQNLYVANCAICSTGQTGSDQVLVYAPGASTPMRTISTGINEPVALAVDSSNNLYVANCMNCGLGAAAYVHGTDAVTEYGNGGTTPLKTITYSGVDVPFSLAVDPSGDLFVGNYAVNTVTDYPPNATSPSETIHRGVSSPASLAIDHAGNLYVSNAGANTVTRYAPGRGRPTATLRVSYPSSIAISL